VRHRFFVDRFVGMLDSLWLNWWCRPLTVLIQLVGCWSSSLMSHDDVASPQHATHHAAAGPARSSDYWDLSYRWGRNWSAIIVVEAIHLRIEWRLTAGSKLDRIYSAMAEGADEGGEGGGKVVLSRVWRREAICVVYDVDDNTHGLCR
jgi:hypothetical protein